MTLYIERWSWDLEILWYSVCLATAVMYTMGHLVTMERNMIDNESGFLPVIVHKGWQSYKHARVKATMYVVHARNDVVVPCCAY